MISFKKAKNVLQHKDGTKFYIHEHNRRYYLESVMASVIIDVQTWHEILGHFNYSDVLKLQNVVEGKKKSWVKQTTKV